jgi:hypothetical protein
MLPPDRTPCAAVTKQAEVKVEVTEERKPASKRRRKA